MALPDDSILELVKLALIFLGGLFSAIVGQQAAKRNARATEKTAQLDTALRPLELANSTWEKLLIPMTSRVDTLESEVKELRQEQHDREGVLLQSLALLVTWGRWIEEGAMPPPPSIPQWVRNHMSKAIHDLYPDKDKDDDK